ncbi:MAG: hypothetical protein H6Q86_4972 [candidate division NC10 bacterium]|nr:hypothetical protein [candidate division NC10 bacterium]
MLRPCFRLPARVSECRIILQFSPKKRMANFKEIRDYEQLGQTVPWERFLLFPILASNHTYPSGPSPQDPDVEGARMPETRSTLNVQPKSNIVRGLIIVARDQPDLWRTLMREFGQSQEIRVLLDRRQGERRKEDQSYVPDRRGVERRSLPRIEDDVRSRQYVLVRPHYRMPRD